MAFCKLVANAAADEFGGQSNEQLSLMLRNRVRVIARQIPGYGPAVYRILLMPTVNIPFPLSSAPGASGHESAGRLINCYAEPLGKDVNTQEGHVASGRRMAQDSGAFEVRHIGEHIFRGMQLVNNTLYAAWSGKASAFDSTGAETTLTGTLLGTDKVFFASNNKVPTPDLVSVSPGNGGFIVGVSAVSSWSAAGAPNSVSFMDGYFLLTYGDGTIQASDLNATTINTLNKTTAQSKPGGLTRGLPFNGQFYALGPVFGEVYADTANPTGFPFTRSYTLQRGLISPYAVAGMRTASDRRSYGWQTTTRL
jgi:hypothetical protein